MGTSLAVLLLLAAPSASDAPSVWVASVTSDGLAAEDAGALPARVVGQLQAANADVVDAEPVDDACAVDLACVGEKTRGAGAGVGVVVRVVRGGPVLQVSTIAVDAAGAEWFREEHLLQAAELADATVLPDGFVERVSRPASDATPAPSPDAPAAIDDGAPKSEAELPVLGIVGLGVAGAGLVAGIVGAAMAVAGNNVLNDGSTTADEKAAAFLYGPAGIGVAVVGGLAAITGGVIAGIGLAGE